MFDRLMSVIFVSGNGRKCPLTEISLHTDHDELWLWTGEESEDNGGCCTLKWIAYDPHCAIGYGQRSSRQ